MQTTTTGLCTRATAGRCLGCLGCLSCLSRALAGYPVFWHSERKSACRDGVDLVIRLLSLTCRRGAFASSGRVACRGRCRASAAQWGGSCGLEPMAHVQDNAWCTGFDHTSCARYASAASFLGLAGAATSQLQYGPPRLPNDSTGCLHQWRRAARPLHRSSEPCSSCSAHAARGSCAPADRM